jgi:hypothetical protein
MKNQVIFLILITLTLKVICQTVDTTYYDSNWRGVKFKELATYIRYDFIFDDENYSNRSRIFLINGILECEGTPLKVDRIDGTRSSWTGIFTSYYYNGRKKEELYYNSAGKADGVKKGWNEGGQLLYEITYSDGVLHGNALRYDPNDPDICYVVLYEDGVPLNNELHVFHRNGKNYTVDYTTRRLITKEPTPADCRNFFNNGLQHWHYEMNGLVITLNYQTVRNNGRFYQFFMQITNNGQDAIEINPNDISGSYVKNESMRDLQIMDSDQYIRRVQRNQNIAQGLAAFNSGMNTANAGYSTSTTTATAVGTRGFATGSSQTTVYNPYERQQALDREQEKLKNMAEANKEVVMDLNELMLKRTSVSPGETVFKSFLVNYLSADQLIINIKLGEYYYPFFIKI